MVRKRKDPIEKLTNKNTKQVQTQRNNMTDQELKIDNAKRANTAATAYAERGFNPRKKRFDLDIITITITMVRKRKDPIEKLTNKNTKQVQTQRNNMTDQELKIDNAKRANTAATAYAVKKL
ncbi:hypothetical protein V498_05776 [Pseudogymnoascus sp. VKM F-4517 (FW-2822)]|nr:hypothetical protein V498_05776 [Pseudogymnoascus sp. VKM F-4517 (FW-2822)]